MVKKHDLFLAVLRSGEGSEKKVACPLDQVLLADSISNIGQWRKASLVRSFVSTALWSLRAIDAHWCRLALSGDENYVPFSLEDPRSIIPDVPAVEPSNLVPPATSANSDDMGLDDGSGDEEDELEGEDEGCGDYGDSDRDTPSGLEFGSINAEEITEILQRVSQKLDTPDGGNLATGGGESLTTNEWVVAFASIIVKLTGRSGSYSSD
jgi:hypothetical protein